MQNFEEIETRLNDLQCLRDYPQALQQLTNKFEIDSEMELKIIKNKFKNIHGGQEAMPLPLISDLQTFSK
jgi:hypothetical protein